MDTIIEIVSIQKINTSIFIYVILMGLGYLYSQLIEDLKQYGYSLLEDMLRRKLKPDIIFREHTIDYATYETVEV